MRRRLALALAALAAGPLAVAAAPAGAAEKLAVPFNAGAFGGGAQPDVVPGANDFACKPTAERPVPVVLVHGLIATAGANWGTMAPLLKNEGFCVFALTYGRRPGFEFSGGLARMEESAKELDAFVTRVLEATGTTQVDLVGHSEGTVMPRWWLHRLGGASKVRRYVQLTPLWRGTQLAGTNVLLAAAKQFVPGSEDLVLSLFSAAVCASCPQFVEGSAYLAEMNAAGPAVPSIRYTTILTKYDELVIPYTSGLLDLPNVTNVVLQDVCPSNYAEHGAVAYDPMTAQIMLNALVPERARKVPCTLMTPLGAPDPPEVRLATAAEAPAPTVATARPCTSRPLTLRLKPRRGERIIGVTVRDATRVRATRRGRALRSITVRGLRPGTRRLTVRVTTTKAVRVYRTTGVVGCR